MPLILFLLSKPAEFVLGWYIVWLRDFMDDTFASLPFMYLSNISFPLSLH